MYLQKRYMYLLNVFNENVGCFFLIFEKIFTVFTDLLPNIDQ